MQVDDGALAGAGFEDGEVVGVGVEAVFCEDGGAEGVAEDVEVLLDVGIAIGYIGSELHAGEVLGCSGV